MIPATIVAPKTRAHFRDRRIRRNVDDAPNPAPFAELGANVESCAEFHDVAPVWVGGRQVVNGQGGRVDLGNRRGFVKHSFHVGRATEGFYDTALNEADDA